jgi:Uma2 family endonuclease
MSSSHAAAVRLPEPQVPEPPPSEPPASERRRTAEPSGDQLFTMNNVSWETYEAIGAAIGDAPGLHLTYLEGTLELMSPGTLHEWVKSTVGRLVEVFAEETGIDISSYGSATFRKKVKERGVEPDECYVRDEGQKMPDLAIEVIFTSGSIDKLDVYAGLGVREVWFWKNGKISAHWLRAGGYEEKKKSRLLPGIDIAELEELLTSGTQSYAVRTYRARLRQRRRASRAGSSRKPRG